jgi:tetratricopeptide (TPR) repeat protein
MDFRNMARQRWAGPAALLGLLVFASVAPAGTISFEITSTVETGDGLKLKLGLKNVGDEAARAVQPTAVIGDIKVTGDRVAVLGPNASQEWSLELSSDPMAQGAYVLVSRVAYEDANAYPFEVLAASPFAVATEPRRPVSGALALPQMRGKDEVAAVLTLRVPESRGRRFDVRLILPAGVRADAIHHVVEAPANGQLRLPLKLRNRSLLPGSSLNAFALITSLDESPPQTDTVRGIVRIGVAPEPYTTSTFISLLLALLVYLAALEIIAGFRGRTSDAQDRSPWSMLADHLLALVPAVFLASQYPWDALLSSTTTGGGDMASLYYPTKLLAEEMMPRGQLTGWTMGNYAGFPALHFYSTLPFAIIALLGKLFPMEQAFKLVTLSGPTLLPIAAAYLFRSLGYGRGAAAIAATSVLPFLLQQGNSMWGGNIPSVLAGEFCHSLGLTLSLFFLATLHQAVSKQRSWVLPAFLLAVVGLCHTFAFLAAVWFSLFFVWPRRGVTDRAAPVVAVYVVAFLLLCFWGLPLPSRLIFTSEWSMIWRIKEWTEVLPKALWPAGILAATNVVWMAASGAYRLASGDRTETAGGLRVLLKPFEVERQGLLLFIIGGGLLLYFLAPAVGFPDIRFIPVSQLFLCLMAADLVFWLGGVLVRQRVVFAACIVAAGLAYSHSHMGYIPSWLSWNYVGYEGKPTWGLFSAINDHVRGDLNDPRVIFEHSQAHNRFGSSRAFENLPLFSGRSTLEGVFHQASPNSPFIFYLQSEASERGSGPFPQYTYTRLDPAKAFHHFRVFNATDIVAVSEKAKEAYEKDPKFEKTFEQGAYAVFHAADAETGYVVAAENEPILYNGPDWKLAFYRWYRHYDLLDVPLVPADLITDAQARKFGLRTDSITRIERNPYPTECEIESTLEQYAVRFTTSCPGRPHIVKVSYFPRWRATDGSAVLPVSPAFMLVVPESEHFEMVYGRNAIDWVGLIISLAGLGLLLACAASAHLRDSLERSLILPLAWLARLFETYPRSLTALLLVAAIGGGWTTRAILRRPDAQYKAAQEAYRAREFDDAISKLEAWLETDRDTFKQATALYQLGVSYTEKKNFGASALAHERLRFQFPNVNYGAGTLYHLANSYAQLDVPDRAREYGRILEEEHPESNWMSRLKREHPTVFTP